MDLNIRSVLNTPNDPQDFVLDILQDPGEPLGLPLPPIPLLEGTDNKDDNSMFDLRQTISIPDTIDMINVLEVATVAVPKAAPDVSPEAAVLKVSAATVEDSGTNRDTSQETDTLGTPMVVVHYTKWYKDYLVSSIDINGTIPDRDFGIRNPVGEVITHNSDKPT